MVNIKVEYASILKRVVLRFARTFVAGFITGMLAQLAATPELTTLGDLNTYLAAGILGGITAGLVAVDKFIRG